jgi:hypothetical protein
MILRLDVLFVYYYYADDRNGCYSIIEWLEKHGGKFDGVEEGFVEISEEDYVVLKLRFGV